MTLYIDNYISCRLSVRNKLQVTFDSIYYFCSDFSSLRGSDLQPLLEYPAGRLFVLIKGMGIDVQRGRGLAVAQEARHRGHVCAVCDEQAGVGVPQGVDVQILRQTVFFRISLNRQVKVEGVIGRRQPLRRNRKSSFSSSLPS